MNFQVEVGGSGQPLKATFLVRKLGEAAQTLTTLGVNLGWRSVLIVAIPVLRRMRRQTCYRKTQCLWRALRSESAQSQDAVEQSSTLPQTDTIPFFLCGVKRMIQKEKISSFDPFKMKAFRCPVCASNEFTELYPYGNVWCNECNAMFIVRGTCDGLNKVAVDCCTEHVHSDYQKEGLPSKFGTVIWKDDTKIAWIAIKNNRIITVDSTPY